MDYAKPNTSFQYVKEKPIIPKSEKITKDFFMALWDISLMNDPCKELMAWIIRSMETAAQEGTLHYGLEISRPIRVSNPQILIERLNSRIDVKRIRITITGDQLFVRI